MRTINVNGGYDWVIGLGFAMAFAILLWGWIRQRRDY